MERVKPTRKPRTNRGSKRGHGKGASFERKVCRDLSKFLTKGERTDLFWRSAMSGGRATVQGKKGVLNLTQAGDISSISSQGHSFIESFVVECKHYKSLDIESGLLFGRGRLANFWRTLVNIAHKAEKHPLLIAKQNNTETLVITNGRGYSHLRHLTTDESCSSLVSQSYPMGELGGDGAHVLLFDKLFKISK